MIRLLLLLGGRLFVIGGQHLCQAAKAVFDKAVLSGEQTKWAVLATVTVTVVAPECPQTERWRLAGMNNAKQEDHVAAGYADIVSQFLRMQDENNTSCEKLNAPTLLLLCLVASALKIALQCNTHEQVSRERSASSCPPLSRPEC